MSKPESLLRTQYPSPQRGEARRGAEYGTIRANNAPTPTLPQWGRGAACHSILKGGALLLLVCTCLTACGVKRPLMRPKDIPAYEEQQRKKREGIEQEQREMQQEISPTQGTN